jgi:RimJ/RimL family protein N-acetyltransferase
LQIAIAEKQDNLLVGDIGILVYLENPTTVEIGFTLDRKAQGKGYAQEAIQALIDFLFDFEGINQVIAITDVRNQPSINLLTRLGMKFTYSKMFKFK